MAVKALQVLVPRARVLYSSATGASEPTNLAYMTRIGSWGFPTMLDMIRTLGRCRPRPSGVSNAARWPPHKIAR